MTIEYPMISYINPGKPVVIDDGYDHTAQILWNMNANARARTRSPFVPAPVPVQVMQPKYDRKVTTGKKVVKKKAKKVDFPASKLAAVMLGKTLSYTAIMAALDKFHPGHGMNRRVLQTRVLAMINSPFVKITRHETPVPEFTLEHVDGQFYVNSERTLEAMV
ncbi:hypothetical protein ABQ366_21045 [Serratia fonticola]|uniref:hypothetical protein n=1 Tax=Serratia fonticola TaxID=47917 RepID=UPI003AAEBBF4